MAAEPDLSRIAATIGDATRIRMLTLLMEGRALTAKELAHGSGISPATATTHLQRLMADALVASTAQGRHKYFRLASAQVAQCVETLLVIAPRAVCPTATAREPIHDARFCYDHLAGRLGVALTEALVTRKRLRRTGPEYAIPPRAAGWFAALGIDLPAVTAQRRRFACGCLDWSERRDHLGGALGAALAARLLALGWIRRRPGTRVVRVTPAGEKAIAGHFGVSWPPP